MSDANLAVSNNSIQKTTYKIFGIPLWSVEKRVMLPEIDQESLYNTMAERFREEMQIAFNKARGA